MKYPFGFLSGATTSDTLSIYPQSNLYDFGDSIGVGQNASNVNATAFVALFNTYITGSRTSASQGGRGLSHMAYNANTLYDETAVGLFLGISGLNDYLKVGHNVLLAKTLRKTEGCYGIFLINALSKKFYTHTDFTETGTAMINLGGGFGTRTAQAWWNTGGTTTLTKTVTGNNFGFAFVGHDGSVYTFGDVTIKVDGVVKKTFSLNNSTDGISDGSTDPIAANTYVPYGVGVLGLGSGSHTIEIVMTSQCIFDFMCELRDYPNEYSNPVVVCGMPYCSSAGYTNGGGGGDFVATNGTIDQGNAVAQSVVNDFKNNGLCYIKFVPFNVLGVAGDWDTDGIHPLDQGHAKLGNALINAVTLLPDTRLFNNLVKIGFLSGKYYPTIKVAQDWQAFGGATSLQATGDCSITFTVADVSQPFGGIGFNTTREAATYTSFEYGAFWWIVGDGLYDLLNGAIVGLRQAGPLALNSKCRIKRVSGTITLDYASDGTNFSTVSTFSGTNNSTLYPNIAMVVSHNAYGLTSTGFA